jgi:ADP-ribosylglycohydrolase
MSNKTTFEELLKAVKINVRNSDLFNTPVKPKENIDFDRVEGMILGVAVGDGLGNTSESMLPADRLLKHGEITDYLANRNGDKKGAPSDDTQFTAWTLEQILKDKCYNPENVAAAFNGKKIFGLGKTVKEFLINSKKGKKWHEAGPDSAGNGSLMRISPMVIPHLKNDEGNLWIDTALCSMTTHNDSAAIASCLALVNLIWEVMDMKTAPEPMYWLEKFIEILKEFEIREDYNPRCIPNIGYRGSLWGYVDKVVRNAYNENLSVLDACNRWFSGAYLFETVPCVIYILMKHGDNFENAIIRAVNDTSDNDTIAAIVGSVLGALHGKSKIPARWLNDLSGRTGDSDDGKIFEILRATDDFLKR